MTASRSRAGSKARSLEEGSVELSGRDGTVLGEATLSGSEASGEAEIEGERRSFSAEPADGEAGLTRGVTAKIGSSGTALFEPAPRTETKFIDPTADL